MEGLPDPAAAGEGHERSRGTRRWGPALSGNDHRIVLWRHGQTVWNVASRFQGQADIPLDETGVAQAEGAARRLAALSPDSIVASDLARAGDTAYALSRVAGVPVTMDTDLRERSMGRWEGLSYTEVQAWFPNEWAARQPAGGETYEQVAGRVVACVQRSLEKVAAGGTLVVVSHGAALRAGMASMLELPVDLWPRIGPLSNGAWSMLAEGRGGWRLLEHNAGSLPEPVFSDDR